MKQTLRIIAGRYRGQKIYFPDIDGLRPTSDRIRETLFNWLMTDIRGISCLDAFAGSGALGFEALSRGAEKVVMVEQARIANQNLLEQKKRLGSTKVDIIQDSALNYLKKSNKAFDLIFLDPPFTKNYLPECLKIIETSNILKPTGLLYVESGEFLELNPKYWAPRKQKKTGQVYYGLYEKQTVL